MATGVGTAPCHHGEILQGAFRDGGGRVCAALVTLPLPGGSGLGSRAEFTPRADAPPGRITVLPADRTKASRAAALAVEECARRTQRPVYGGRLRLGGGVPIGLGMGSSSSDVIAAVRAVAASYGIQLPPTAVARLAVRAESACDPLMLDGRPVLFAQREGRVLETLGAALPPAVVVGCATGGGRPVDTLALQGAAHREADLRAFERLRALLRRAVGTGDAALLGEVCTESALRHQRLLPKEELPALRAVAAEVGAVGVQVAHSGNVAGIVFDPATPDLRGRLRRCVRALAREGTPAARAFRTTTPPSHERPSDHVRPRGRRDRRPGSDTARRGSGVPAL
ncbi:GHMP kinase [Streptomyces radicis]|uniref:GHMP kinase n=1 Tax=Streptomyces radicis TaxID=1750517 RepID=A0A3A9VTX8_9ACTN|nr:GHMP kinase [Streptomyces radicis]RKN15519.1 GHMP kinase [Streptomyces radicis]